MKNEKKEGKARKKQAERVESSVNEIFEPQTTQ
jgi:hypothetical protein